MPLPDITVDTNVLLHSCNPVEPRFKEAIAFLQGLLNATAKLAIDEGFSLDEATNRSLIGAEYLAKIVPGTLPNYVLAQLAMTERIVATCCSLKPQESKQLNQLVANRRDRTFIKVCANSSGKTLVSHDFDDFPKPIRRVMRSQFGIALLEASAAIPLL